LVLWELYRRRFDTHHIFAVDEFYWEDRPRYYAALDVAICAWAAPTRATDTINNDQTSLACTRSSPVDTRRLRHTTRRETN